MKLIQINTAEVNNSSLKYRNSNTIQTLRIHTQIQKSTLIAIKTSLVTPKATLWFKQCSCWRWTDSSWIITEAIRTWFIKFGNLRCTAQSVCQNSTNQQVFIANSWPLIVIVGTKYSGPCFAHELCLMKTPEILVSR